MKSLLYVCITLLCGTHTAIAKTYHIPKVASTAKTLATQNINLTKLTYMGEGKDHLDLKSKLDITLITEAEFREQQAFAIPTYISNHLQDTDGLTIYCADNTHKTIKNINTDLDDMQTHEYENFLPSIQMIQIKSTYWEHIEFSLFDAHTCQLVDVFDAINGNKVQYDNRKYLFTINFDPYEATPNGDDNVGNIIVAKLDTGKPLQQYLYNVPWTIVLGMKDNDEPFMNKDGYFYFPIIDANQVWDIDGNYNEVYQFAKLRIR